MNCNEPIELELIGSVLQGPPGSIKSSRALLGYLTKPEAVEAAKTLPDEQLVDVESEQKRYYVSKGKLVFIRNLNQLEQDLSSSSGSDHVHHQAEGDGAIDTTVQKKLREWVTIEDYGGKGNGKDSDADALEKAQIALPNGGVIRGRNGKTYRFPDGLVLKQGISFLGAWIPHEDLKNHDPLTKGSALIVGSAGVSVGNGAECSDWLIWRDGLTPATNAEDAAAKVAAFSGTGVTASSADSKVRRNTIIGFNQAAISTGVERAIIEDNHFDCTHGIDVSQSYDITHVRRNHGWPFFTVHREWTTGPLLQRGGTAFKIHQTADFIHVVENFAYGYMKSYYFEDLAAGTVLGNKGDNVIASAAGRIGVETRGMMNNVVFDDNHIDSHDVNYRWAHTSGCVVGGTNTSGQCVSLAVQCGPSSNGTLGNFSIAGSCTFAVAFVEGIGKWFIGTVTTRSVTTSGYVYSFSQADRKNIQIGWTTVIDTETEDNLSYGSSVNPSIRPSHKSSTGLFVNPLDGTLGVSVNGKPAALFPPTTNAVNFLAVKQGATGQSVVIAAEGEANVTLSLMPKGGGSIQLGVAHTDGALTPTGSIGIYDSAGVYRRLLVG